VRGIMIESDRKYPEKHKKYKLKIPKEEFKELLKNNFDKIVEEYDFLIYTDGGYNASYDVGSWSYLIKVKHNKKRFKFHKESGVYNYTEYLPIFMELTAVIEAIKYVTNKTLQEKLCYKINSITIYTDCRQIIYSKELCEKYEENNWKYIFTEFDMHEKLKKAWQKLNTYNDNLNIQYVWIKGHNGNISNEYVDKVCTSRIKERLHQEKIFRFNNEIINQKIEENE
jgi:ribonuclease HI